MSQGQPIPLAEAEPVAERLVALLTDACDRIAIAGSIRRRKPMVSDIEVVAIPTLVTEARGDLWGEGVIVNQLLRRVAALVDSGRLQRRQVEVHRANGTIESQERDGNAYKALVSDGVPVDLFIVNDPATWGTIFAIRTGPADWGKRIVTDCQRYLRRVEGGKVYRSGLYVPCPEEADFFRAVGQPWVEPSERAVDRVSIQAVA